MLKRTIFVALAFSLAACGNGSSGPGPKNGGDGDGKGNGSKGGATASGKKVEEGSSVCVSELLGVRYAIEDVLEEFNLNVTGDCMFADVEIAEHGEPGAYEMKYRAVGEQWQSCKSKASDRVAFIKECADAIITSSGGGGGEGEGEGEEG